MMNLYNTNIDFLIFREEEMNFLCGKSGFPILENRSKKEKKKSFTTCRWLCYKLQCFMKLSKLHNNKLYIKGREIDGYPNIVEALECYGIGATWHELQF